jgi:hypothetical protein
MNWYQDLLEGEEEYLWHLKESRNRALNEFVEYTIRIEKQENLINQTKLEKTKREAMHCLPGALKYE